jgi:hypothetical protein
MGASRSFVWKKIGRAKHQRALSTFRRFLEDELSAEEPQTFALATTQTSSIGPL